MNTKWNVLAQPICAKWFVDDDAKIMENGLILAWLPIYRQGSQTVDGIGWLDEHGNVLEFEEDQLVMWEVLK